MLKIGRFNEMTVLKQLPRGLQLDGGEAGEILLPKQYVSDDMSIGSKVNVFIYRDSEERLIATTQTPMVQEGEFAYLNVVDESKFGAFLDWGLPKDLFVPFSEQTNRLAKGTKVLVRVYLDDNDRLTASAKLDTFLYDIDEGDHFQAGEKVNITVGPKTDLGIKVIINSAFWGLVYHNDVYQDLHRGDKLIGYIQRLREDKKLEVSLQPPGQARIEPLAQEILDKLAAAGGFIALSDKSAPQDIKNTFNCSKSSFKQAIGRLYKHKLIVIDKTGITLVK